MKDPKNEYSEAQLQKLAELMPESVRIDEAGRIVPLVSREEVRILAQRYPSQFGQSAAESSQDVDPALVARFPSMFKK